MRTKQEQKQLLKLVLEEFTAVMFTRLCEKVDEGKEGFDDPKYVDTIAAALNADTYFTVMQQRTGKFHDIANRAMFLWWQDKEKGKSND